MVPTESARSPSSSAGREIQFTGSGPTPDLTLDADAVQHARHGLSVGRDPALVDCPLPLPDLSSRHFRVSRFDGCLFVEDLNSANGTAVNGTPLVPYHGRAITVGDVIVAGEGRWRLSATVAASTRGRGERLFGWREPGSTIVHGLATGIRSRIASRLPALLAVVVGSSAGALAGYLLRPAVALVGQLPWSVVITRGGSLDGLERLLAPVARQSFDRMLLGAVLGALAGWCISLLARRYRGQTSSASP